MFFLVSDTWSQVVTSGGPFPARYLHTTVLSLSTGTAITIAGSSTAALTDVWAIELFGESERMQCCLRACVSVEG